MDESIFFKLNAVVSLALQRANPSNRSISLRACPKALGVTIDWLFALLSLKPSSYP